MISRRSELCYAGLGRKQSIVHYALRGMSQPIRVSTYELGNALPEAVQQTLPSVEQLQMEIESD